MAVIRFAGCALPVVEGETVLETLLAAGFDIPNGCRAGSCQSCVMQRVSGEVDAAAQQGLKDSWQAQGLFLACQCRPASDLELRLPDASALRVECVLAAREALGSEVMLLRLQPQHAFAYRPGQHVILWRDERLGRSYSLASVPAVDGDLLTFHIRRLPGGAVSPWLCDGLKVGERIDIQGPGGDCFYTGGDPAQPLLLAGTGTGLAPLYGILRDALGQGHQGEIHLYHGALRGDGLYLHSTLRQMAREHANFHYHPSILEADPGADEDIPVEPLGPLLKRECPDLAGWKVYLCGADDLVRQLQRQCFLAGAGLQDIYTDAFTG